MIEALDTGNDLPDCSPHSVAEVLLEFIAALPHPLLPPSCYPYNEIEQQQLRPFCRKIMDDLPPLNYNLFVYLISFFREILVCEAHNKTTPPLLAELLVNAMMYETDETELLKRSSSISKEDIEKRVAKKQYLVSVIVFLLITNTL